MKNKKVVIFGVFDGLHAGHLFLIQKAKKAGTNLFVIVAKDKIVQKLKNKIPKYNQKERIKALNNISHVDKVFLGDSKLESYLVLKKIKPHIVYLGHDQQELYENLSLFIQKGLLPKIKLIQGKFFKTKK